MQRTFAVPALRPNHSPVRLSLMFPLCVLLSGCLQTAASDQSQADKVERGIALRAELEAGCVTQGYAPGSDDFQACVGRASVPYANAGFSKAKVMHQGIKRAPEAMQVYNTGIQIARAAAVLSDARLKQELLLVGSLPNGIPLYRFTYIGGTQQLVGVLAQDVLAVVPSAVHAGSDGFLRVDYEALGFTLTTWQGWIRAR